MSGLLRTSADVVRRHWNVLLVAATLAAVVGLFVHQIAMHGLEVHDWDYMFVSGSLATLAGLWLAKLQPQRFDLLLERLGDRRALKRARKTLSETELNTLADILRSRSKRVARVVALLLALTMGAVWGVVTLGGESKELAFDSYAGPIVGAVGGALVGWAIGRIISYGRLGADLNSESISFEVTPPHPDGAAGLKPLGDFYLFQALLLAFPAAYLAAWSLLILFDITPRYDYWLEPYLGLLALVICLELAAFALPLWSVHRVMSAQKRARLALADRELGATIADLNRQLDQDLPADRRLELTDQLEQLGVRYREAETMPTWPVDQSLRRRLTVGNLVLLIPLAGQVVKLAQ